MRLFHYNNSPQVWAFRKAKLLTCVLRGSLIPGKLRQGKRKVSEQQQHVMAINHSISFMLSCLVTAPIVDRRPTPCVQPTTSPLGEFRVLVSWVMECARGPFHAMFPATSPKMLHPSSHEQTPSIALLPSSKCLGGIFCVEFHLAWIEVGMRTIHSSIFSKFKI